MINKKDIARIVKNIFKVKLKSALCSLKLYQKGTFLTHFFLEIFRVTVVLNKFFKKNITMWLYQNQTEPRTFLEESFDFFRTAISQKSSERLRHCLVSNIIIVVVELCKSNCKKNTRRYDVTSPWTLGKSDEGLKRTELFAQRCFRKKLIWKTVTKSFFSYVAAYKLNVKELYHKLFSCDFCKIF